MINKYLPMMTEDEIHYLCSVIPSKDAKTYFTYHSKEFSKICPGFRASSLEKLDISNLLYRNRRRGFIEFFLEKHISDWHTQIQKNIEKCMSDGNSKEMALLKILPLTYFAENICLYFKLIGEEYSEDTLLILNASIRTIKESNTKRERIKTVVKNKLTEINQIKIEFTRIQSELYDTSKKLNEKTAENKELKHTIADLENLNVIIKAHEQSIERLKENVHEREDYITRLKNELTATKEEHQKLEMIVREELEKQQEKKYMEQEAARNPQSPIDIDDFKDYLGYNLKNIGLPTSADYYALLKDYLSDVIFKGKPLIISMNTGFTLMKCISNTLVNTPVVPILKFASGITEQAIDVFLSRAKRLVCLDNFIGNYNETILITILRRHEDKIIFLTVAYDRTLYYVPDELMVYCHYLNLNRIEAFLSGQELTEDPSNIDETESANPEIHTGNRWSSLLKELLNDFGLGNALSVYKSGFVADEVSLCRTLAFDVLPYCVDVLEISPYNSSERLVKYAGDGSKCPYKDLFKRWFA